jgi:hypothetical protein
MSKPINFKPGMHDEMLTGSANPARVVGIAHTATYVHEGVSENSGCPFRGKINCFLSGAYASKRIDVHTMYDRGHATRSCCKSSKNPRFTLVCVDNVGVQSSEHPDQISKRF